MSRFEVVSGLVQTSTALSLVYEDQGSWIRAVFDHVPQHKKQMWLRVNEIRGELKCKHTLTQLCDAQDVWEKGTCQSSEGHCHATFEHLFTTFLTVTAVVSVVLGEESLLLKYRNSLDEIMPVKSSDGVSCHHVKGAVHLYIIYFFFPLRSTYNVSQSWSKIFSWLFSILSLYIYIFFRIKLTLFSTVSFKGIFHSNYCIDFRWLAWQVHKTIRAEMCCSNSQDWNDQGTC